VPFVFTWNGDGFLFHDLTATDPPVERELSLDAFPTPETLLRKYQRHVGLTDEGLELVTQDYYTDTSGKEPRYYQINAINRTLEAIAKGQDRILLVMATGTGKTYTAFQVIWRLWKAGARKRILFLADRNNPRRPNQHQRLQAVRRGHDEDLQPEDRRGLVEKSGENGVRRHGRMCIPHRGRNPSAGIGAAGVGGRVGPHVGAGAGVPRTVRAPATRALSRSSPSRAPAVDARIALRRPVARRGREADARQDELSP
jgi:hypothetical protein